jgi:hypothetical protein
VRNPYIAPAKDVNWKDNIKIDLKEGMMIMGLLRNLV